jgi:kynurenine formamidase
MKLLKLSHPIHTGMAIYPGAPAVAIRPHRRIACGDRYNSYAVELFNHCGTHLDAPRHVYDDGPSLADFAPDELIFRYPHVVSIPAAPEELITSARLQAALEPLGEWDFLAIRTGFERHRLADPDRYAMENPGLAPEATRWLLKHVPNVRCLGLDTISLAAGGSGLTGWQAHRAWLDPQQGRRLVLEGLVLAEDLPELKWVWAVPLEVEGIDSNWCTVLAQAVTPDGGPTEDASEEGQGTVCRG